MGAHTLLLSLNSNAVVSQAAVSAGSSRVVRPLEAAHCVWQTSAGLGGRAARRVAVWRLVTNV
jgi:hypothetical protein